MKQIGYLKWAGSGLLSIGIIMGLAACSGGGGGGSGASSGLSVSGVLTINSASGLMDPATRFQSAFSTTGTSISLDCGTNGVFTGTVDSSTGAFSVSGMPVGVPCTFSFVNSTSGVTKCQVQFQDSSSYDLNHNPMSTNTASLSSSVSLGSITCDSTGNVTVSSSSVANLNSSSNVASGTAFDFTGVWTAAAFTGNMPTGYQTITSCSSNCHGPGIGDPISLVRFHGYKFTPGSGHCTPAINVSCPVSDGSVDNTVEGYAMSIWGGDYAHGIGACGGHTGFTADEARAYAQLSLDSTPPTLAGNALTYADYAWTTPTGFAGDTGWTEPWMYTGARSQWAISDCQPVSVPSTSGAAARPGFACFSQLQSSTGPTGTYAWNVGLQNSGGCVDSNNNPVMVSNWASLTGSCSNSTSSFNSNMNTSTCTYTGAPVSGQASITFSCTFTGGAFKDISGTTNSAAADNGPDFTQPSNVANSWPGQPATIIAQNGTCANTAVNHDETTLLGLAGGTASATQAAAAKELLVRYQCYANNYWQHSSNGAGSTSCARDYNFNWATNNYAQFVLGDDHSRKPQNAFITDRVFYSSDGQWAFLKNVDTRFETVPTPSGGQLCPLNVTTELKFKRVNDNELLVDFTQSTAMADNSATCQGAVTAAMAGGGNLSPDPQGLNNLYQELQTQRMLFLLTK